MVHQLYLKDLGVLLREQAVAARDDVEQQRATGNSQDQRYARGILVGYVGALVLIQQQGEEFGLSREELGLPGFDAVRDLLGGSQPIERRREGAERGVPASNERPLHQRYLAAVAGKLREAAIEAKEQDEEQRKLDSEDKLYAAGRMMGYVEVLSLMQQQSVGFQIPLHHIGLEGIDPERDLFSTLPPGGLAALRERWIRK